MNIDNDTDGSPENYDELPESNSNQLKEEIEGLKAQNQELLHKFNTFFSQQQQATEKQKSVTPDEFKEILDKDPNKAIEIAFAQKFDLKAKEIEANLTAQQQTKYFDGKAETDFPLLLTDKQFQNLVRQEANSLIEDGMPKNSPKLLYRAAQNAALKSGATTDKKNEQGSRGSQSSEAPSTVKKSSDANLPKSFDRMARMFNMSDKAKEIFKRNQQAAENTKSRRPRG